MAHKSISYRISYTSWMPKLDKKVAKITFSPFLVSVLQHIVELSGCVLEVRWIFSICSKLGGGVSGLVLYK